MENKIIIIVFILQRLAHTSMGYRITIILLNLVMQRFNFFRGNTCLTHILYDSVAEINLIPFPQFAAQFMVSMQFSLDSSVNWQGVNGCVKLNQCWACIGASKVPISIY